MIDKNDKWEGVRPLHQVVEGPILRPDGSVLQKEGLDEATGILYKPSEKYPEVDVEPTRAQCLHHLDAIKEVVQDFPFKTKEDFSAWLAGLLTSVSRPTVDGPTPLFVVDASTPATGKTRLVQVTSLLATGKKAATVALPRDEAEANKLIAAILLHGDSFVNLDNCLLDSPTLESAITSSAWLVRKPGTSSLVEVQNRVVWWATGTNVTLHGDLARRTLRIRLDSGRSDPENRTDFKHPELFSWVKRDRARLVVNALSILRGYVVADRPRHRGTTWWSFESWSNLIPGAIQWLDLPDPRLARVRADDPRDLT